MTRSEGGKRDGRLNGVDFQVTLQVNSVVSPDILHCKHPFLPTSDAGGTENTFTTYFWMPSSNTDGSYVARASMI